MNIMTHKALIDMMHIFYRLVGRSFNYGQIMVIRIDLRIGS